ncbi:MAG: nitrous oxide reductase accessory protein NosL [Sphingobacteriales bacterium]|nr:nitrous oxide reductase accessory protein NosL [Sphingobacteriales bacterium]
MKKVYFFLFVCGLTGLGACRPGPTPFVYGKDICYTCKMGIIDPKFGAELITKKGKLYKFDDVICLNQYLKTGATEEKEIRQTVVVNFEKGNEFLDIHTASFLVAPDLKSPMGSHAAAFATKTNAEKARQEIKGELLNWKELSAKLE